MDTMFGPGINLEERHISVTTEVSRMILRAIAESRFRRLQEFGLLRYLQPAHLIPAAIGEQARQQWRENCGQ